MQWTTVKGVLIIENNTISDEAGRVVTQQVHVIGEADMRDRIITLLQRHGWEDKPEPAPIDGVGDLYAFAQKHDKAEKIFVDVFMKEMFANLDDKAMLNLAIATFRAMQCMKALD